MGYEFDFKVILDNLDEFVPAIRMTLTVSAVALLVALVLGLIVALMRISKSPLLTVPAQAYINFFRGAPLYVLIFWVYYGVATAIGVNFQPFTAGVIALSTAVWRLSGRGLSLGH